MPQCYGFLCVVKFVLNYHFADYDTIDIRVGCNAEGKDSKKVCISALLTRQSSLAYG